MSLTRSGYNKKQALWQIKLMIRSGYDEEFMKMCELASANTYMLHNHSRISEITCKSMKLPTFKEAPRYRDLEYKHKKKRF